MITAGKAGKYLQEYIQRYRLEYARFTASPPVGGCYPQLKVSRGEWRHFQVWGTIGEFGRQNRRTPVHGWSPMVADAVELADSPVTW